MIQNSVGNITEILHLLDKDIYNEQQIAENYKQLVEKWGEWEIVGANSAGLVIRYVDIRNALFSGLMITYTILCVVSLVLAIVIGKILFPQLSKSFVSNNDELVDMTTLQNAQKIDEMVKKQKENKKEWF